MSAIGPALYQWDKSWFDVWEIASFVLVPIVYLLAGLVICRFRVRHLDPRGQPSRRYGLYFGTIVFLMAVFQAVMMLMISPGGPPGVQPYLPAICVVYALLIAILDYHAWRILSAAKDIRTNASVSNESKGNRAF